MTQEHDEALVEAMARALAENDGRTWEYMADPADVAWFDQDERGFWRNAARAALTARATYMREEVEL